MEVEKRYTGQSEEIERLVERWGNRFFEIAVYVFAFLTVVFLFKLEDWVTLIWVVLAVICFAKYRAWRSAFKRLQKDYKSLLKEALDVDKKMRELEKCDTKQKPTENGKN